MNKQPSEIDINWLETCIKTASSSYAFQWCEEMVHHLTNDKLRKKLFKLIDETAKNLMMYGTF